MKKHTLASVIATSFTFLGLFILLTSVTLASWRSPTQGPTNGNPAIPINMGSSEQTKTGRLTVNQFVVNSGMLVSGKVGIDPTSTNEKLNVGGRVDATGFCINGDCDFWSASGDGVTSITAGSGLTASPNNPITSTGTISVNTNAIQTRVSGSCSSGSAIRLIRANGTVICESTSGGGSGGSYTAGNGLQLSGSTFSIDSPACGSNQHSRWTGSSWVCNTDQTGGGGGGGGVSGSGSENWIPKWSNSTTLTNSILLQQSDSPGFYISDGGSEDKWIGVPRNKGGLRLATDGIWRITIQEDGDVGVGTSNPQNKLHVQGGGIRIERNTNRIWELDYDFSGKYFYIDQWGTARHLVIKEGGDVGIGTVNPDAKLHIRNYNSGLGDRTIFAESDARGGHTIYGYNSNTSGAIGVHGLGYTGVSGESIATNGFGVYGKNTGAYGGNGGWGVYCGGDKCGGTKGWSNTSDERLKTNIAVIPNALDKTLSLRGVTFNWKDDLSESDAGIIAQDVIKVLPEIVSVDNDGHYTVETSQINALLIEAIKELKEENDSLREDINILKDLIL